MSNHGQILSRVLTVEFFRINAGFFLLIGGLCFGFMRGQEHIALAGFFVSSIPTLLIPIAVWIIYTVKVVIYNSSEVREDRNLFLFALPLLPLAKRWPALFGVAAGQLSPVVGYAFLICAVALKVDRPQAIPPTLFVVFALCVVIAWLLDQSLVHPRKQITVSTPGRWLDRILIRPLPWMLTEGILRSHPGLIYGTKVFTCLILYGTTHLYQYEDYDARLYWMAACVAFSANLQLVYQYQRFEVSRFLLLRSLPISLWRRAGSLVLTMMVLCFPEIAMLWTNLPDVLFVHDYVYALAFGFTLILFAYGALYVRDSTFDNFTKWIFFVGMGWTLAILFGISPMIGAVVQGAIGLGMLHRYFYRFELKT